MPLIKPKTKVENEEANEPIENQKESKKEKKERLKKEKSEKNKGGIVSKIISLIIFLVFIGVLVSIFVFNLFGVRDKYIYPALSNVPIVKNVIPEQTSHEVGNAALSKEELVLKINVLQAELDAAISDNLMLQDKIVSQNVEMLRLQEIEAQHDQFEQDKLNFDTMIAKGDVDAFMEFYESISPDNLAPLYQEALLTKEEEAEVKKYLGMFSSMDASAVADIMTNIMGRNSRLAIAILKGIDQTQCGEILSAMDADKAAILTRQMAPTKLTE